MHEILTIVLLAAVAFCYAAVGHGGASGYIAIFALAGLQGAPTKLMVLTMNSCVAAVAFVRYVKWQHFPFKIFLVFILGAAPMAYVGAGLKLQTGIYQKILSCFLLFSIVHLLFAESWNKWKLATEFSYSKALIPALVIGLMSGITGVGGGIFLSPLLLLLGWADFKQVAAVSALFIVVNSLMGMAAITWDHHVNILTLICYVVVVVFAGYMGSSWGVKQTQIVLLKRMLAFVLLIAAVKLYLTA